MMRSLRPSLVAGAIAVALSSGLASAQYSNNYFFGDSLTDNGTYKPIVPPGGGLFTTNPGPIWVTPVAQFYGFQANPAATTPGGTDYAQGGARVSVTPASGSPLSVAAQITQYLGAGLNTGAVHAVWAGANDVRFQLSQVVGGIITPAQAQANVAQSAVDLVGQVARLQGAGAHYLVVFNLPDIGKTPDGIASGQSASITALSQLFNSTLNAGLNQVGGNVLRLNTFALLNEVIANPTPYGILNTTARACGATDSLTCTSANLVTPNAAQTYLFADGIHPTTAGHAIIAQYVLSTLQAPMQAAALGQAPLGVEEANWRALDARMTSGINVPVQGTVQNSKYQAWASYDYGQNDFKGIGVSGQADLNTVTVGGDVRLSDRLLAGLAFGYTESKTDFNGGAGSFTLREPTMTGYVGYGDGPWYVGATFGAGGLDYSSIQRNIQLGALTRTESAEASGNHVIARLLGGYWFQTNNWTHGPFARLTWQEAKVKQFSENGNDSTALSYGQQEVTSFQGSLGYQVGGYVSGFRPFARAAWEFEGRDGGRNVTISSVTLGGNYSVQAFTPDDNWGVFTLGAARDFGKVTGYIQGNASAGKSDGDYWGITIGIRAPL